MDTDGGDETEGSDEGDRQIVGGLQAVRVWPPIVSNLSQPSREEGRQALCSPYNLQHGVGPPAFGPRLEDLERALGALRVEVDGDGAMALGLVEALLDTVYCTKLSATERRMRKGRRKR